MTFKQRKKQSQRASAAQQLAWNFLQTLILDPFGVQDNLR